MLCNSFQILHSAIIPWLGQYLDSCFHIFQSSFLLLDIPAMFLLQLPPPREPLSLLNIRSQYTTHIQDTRRLLIQKLQPIHSFPATRPLQRQKGEMPTNNRPGFEGNTGEAAIAFGVVEICHWEIYSREQKIEGRKKRARVDGSGKGVMRHVPVEVSFTHSAMDSTTSSRTCLLATATAKNSQSLFA